VKGEGKNPEPASRSKRRHAPIRKEEHETTIKKKERQSLSPKKTPFQKKKEGRRNPGVEAGPCTGSVTNGRTKNPN